MYIFHQVFLQNNHLPENETHQDCLSPEVTLRKQSPMGSIWYTSILLCLVKGAGTFKISNFRRPFWNPENVLSPGGMLRKQLPRGPIDTLSILLVEETVLVV